jgi:LPXTG-motif cell wall-anchored protein
MIKKLGFSLAALALVAAASVPTASAKSADAVSIYLDAPLVQGSFAAGTSGTTTEDFNSFSAGACPTTWAVGTITGVCNISSVLTWGGSSVGANSTTPSIGGAGSNYATTANNTDSFTLTLSAPSKYVGLYWTAGSPSNRISFFDGNKKIIELTTASIMELLGTAPVDANDWLTIANDPAAVIDSGIPATKYKRAYYFGNPRAYTANPPTEMSSVSGVDPWTYLHLFASGTVEFDSVQFSGGGFEFDNLAVSTSAKTPPASLAPAGFINADHTATFDANGGEGTMEPITANVSGNLPANTLTNANEECTFDGWNTEADGSGTAYADGAAFSFETNETMYAQWDCPEEEVAVEEEEKELAQTGSTNSSPLFATFALLALGSALLLLSRRTRRS